MIHPAIPVTLLALAAPAAIGLGEAADADGAWVTGMVQTIAERITIHERITIRLPRMPVAAPVPVPVAWREKKGPKCVNPADLGGAIFGQPGYVDLVLAGNRRLRARYEGGCNALDFYSGVYLRPGEDGRICAARDAIRTRSGATCAIGSFRSLVPKK